MIFQRCSIKVAPEQKHCIKNLPCSHFLTFCSVQQAVFFFFVKNGNTLNGVPEFGIHFCLHRSLDHLLQQHPHTFLILSPKESSSALSTQSGAPKPEPMNSICPSQRLMTPTPHSCRWTLNSEHFPLPSQKAFFISWPIYPLGDWSVHGCADDIVTLCDGCHLDSVGSQWLDAFAKCFLHVCLESPDNHPADYCSIYLICGCRVHKDWLQKVISWWCLNKHYVHNRFQSVVRRFVDIDWCGGTAEHAFECQRMLSKEFWKAVPKIFCQRNWSFIWKLLLQRHTCLQTVSLFYCNVVRCRNSGTRFFVASGC